MLEITLTTKTKGVDELIALRGIQFISQLAGMSQRTRVEQTFVNRGPDTVEATYTFPLPDDAAVCDFEIVTNSGVLTGILEERNRAISNYEETLQAGDAAYMLEEERPDVFTVRVGSLKSGEAVTIRLTYTAPLQVVDGTVRLVYPTTIAPRYVSADGMDPLEALIDGDALNPPVASAVPYGVRLEVVEDLGGLVESVMSPSHNIDVTDRPAGGHEVALSSDLVSADRDIVLQLQLRNTERPAVQVGDGPDEAKYIAVSFMPQFTVDALAAPPASETIFLLDCSGSMHGTSIDQARRALDLCLRSMAEGDVFNIVRFGSTFEKMESEPVPYTPRMLNRALDYVANIDADLGGTELYAPLENILTTAPQRGCRRQVIVLTDGQVSNEPGIIRLARRHASKNRIFVFGIGPASSKYLVNGLASATGGMAEFITMGERIEDKVVRTFSRLASPAVENVRLDWDGAEVELASDQLPPVFDGDVFCALARVRGKLPSEVTLSCDTPEGHASWSIPLADSIEEESPVLATAWARARIAALERAIEARDRDSRLVALSTKYHVLCSATAFIAVKHRSIEERENGRPPEQRIPVMLPVGWGGIRYSPPRMATTCDFMLESEACMAVQPRRSSPSRRPSLFRRMMPSLGRSDNSEQPSEESVLTSLLRCQSYFGRFEDIDKVDQLPGLIQASWGLTVDDARARVNKFLRDQFGGQASEATDTVLALLVLQFEFQDDKSVWTRAFRKAVRWIRSKLSGLPEDIPQWLGAVRTAITGQSRTP